MFLVSKGKLIIIGLLLWLCGVGLYQNVFRSLPDGVSILGDVHEVSDGDVVFLSDETYVDQDGGRHTQQAIFDEVFRLIDEAGEYVLVDMFLFNDFQGESPENTRALSRELTEALIEKKKNNPNMDVVLISDPINTVYGGQESRHYTQLRDAGVLVVVTDLTELRDSNPIYSVLWRTFLQWFGNSDTKGFLVNPFEHEGHLVTVRSYLTLLNFKANHRKLVVADAGDDVAVLVTSANPHDGSSAHGNVALVVKGGVYKDVLASERSVGEFSGVPVPDFEREATSTGDVKIRLATEEKIKDVLVEKIDKMEEGAMIDMAVFYLADRDVVKALQSADERGVLVRLILDPNKDAFGHEKNGVPNRPVAHELLSHSVGNTQVRWCDTHGEQCHAKITIFTTENSHAMLLGSANLTRRNIADYNLETNIFVEGEDVTAISDAQKYFNRLWNNEDGRGYTVEYDAYEDTSFFKTFLYRIMEGLGTSSF